MVPFLRVPPPARQSLLFQFLFSGLVTALVVTAAVEVRVLFEKRIAWTRSTRLLLSALVAFISSVLIYHLAYLVWGWGGGLLPPRGQHQYLPRRLS